MAAVRELGEQLELLGPPIEFRKLDGILDALMMQVEDGDYHPHAVSRLCEALLATAALYDIPEDKTGRLEELTLRVIEQAERRG